MGALTWAPDIHVQYVHLLLGLRGCEGQRRRPADVGGFEVLLRPRTAVDGVVLFREQSLIFSLRGVNTVPVSLAHLWALWTRRWSRVPTTSPSVPPSLCPLDFYPHQFPTALTMSFLFTCIASPVHLSPPPIPNSQLQP